MKVQADLVPGRNPLPRYLLAVSSQMEKERKRSKLSDVSTYKNTNPIRYPLLPIISSEPNYLSKAPYPNTITLEVRVSILNLGLGGMI